MTHATSGAPTFRALLIGCDHYFPNRLPNGGRYEPLHGCVRDIDRIERMLRARIALPLAITRLTATNGQGQPVEPRAEWPTAANLRAKLEEVIGQAQRGDQVYIHYSGHGGRVVTAHADLKGAGAVDEGLVPIDIGNPEIVAGNYLRDVELAGFVTRIAARIGAGTPDGGALSLTFDSCHSGGSTRGAAALAMRCATGGRSADTTLDTTPLGAGEHAANADARRAWAELRREAGAPRSAGSGTRWLPPSGSYVLLAACTDTEFAIETIVGDQQPGGVLTDAFLEALGSLTGKPSWLTVYNRVRASVQARFISQTPQLLGEPTREVFGAELRSVEPFAPVLEVDAARRRVRVGAGLTTLIERGAELGIFRPETLDFTAKDALVATATVTQAQPTECWADLDPTSNPAQIALGAPAVVLRVTVRRNVAVFRRTDLGESAAAAQDAALSAVAAALATSGRGSVVEARGAAPDYQVAVNQHGDYEIWDPSGNVIPYATPAVRAVPANAAAVVDRLLRLARYRSVLDLSAPRSALEQSVEVALLASPPRWKSGDSMPAAQALSPLVRTDNVHPVGNDDTAFLSVTNRGAQPVHVAAIDLTCDWGIDLLVPHPNTGASSEIVGAGETRLFPLTMYLPPGFTTTHDIVKVFVAARDAPFASLQQPVLGKPFMRRGTTRGAATGALARVFDEFDAEFNTTRAIRPAMSPDLAWTIFVFHLEVK